MYDVCERSENVFDAKLLFSVAIVTSDRMHKHDDEFRTWKF